MGLVGCSRGFVLHVGVLFFFSCFFFVGSGWVDILWRWGCGDAEGNVSFGRWMVDLFISCPLKVLKFDTSVSFLQPYHRTARQLEFLFILCGERYRVMDHE